MKHGVARPATGPLRYRAGR